MQEVSRETGTLESNSEQTLGARQFTCSTWSLDAAVAPNTESNAQLVVVGGPAKRFVVIGARCKQIRSFHVEHDWRRELRRR